MAMLAIRFGFLAIFSNLILRRTIISLFLCQLREFFLIISIIIILLYELLFSEIKNEWLKATLLTFIIFGAISNVLDRLRYGFVIDYLDLKYFTVFNIADIMIVGGVLGLVLIFRKKVN